jgi:hypothetical protein
LDGTWYCRETAESGYSQTPYHLSGGILGVVSQAGSQASVLPSEHKPDGTQAHYNESAKCETQKYSICSNSPPRIARGQNTVTVAVAATGARPSTARPVIIGIRRRTPCVPVSGPDGAIDRKALIVPTPLPQVEMDHGRGCCCLRTCRRWG